MYSFFAPALEKRSLGTYAILWLIKRAQSLGLPNVYLGYWVPESRKMAYKSRFRPAEVLAGGAWRMLTEADAGEGPGRPRKRWCRKARIDAPIRRGGDRQRATSLKAQVTEAGVIRLRPITIMARKLATMKLELGRPLR